MDDMLMYLDEGILHPIRDDLDVPKHKEDRLLQMNEELTEKLDKSKGKQMEFKNFVQRQAQHEDAI